MAGPASCAEVQRSGGDWLETGACRAVLLVEATRTAVPPYRIEGRVLAAGALTPLPGANVRLASGTGGAATDAAGRFAVGGVSATESLIVSYVGFHSDTLAARSVPGPRSGRVP